MSKESPENERIEFYFPRKVSTMLRDLVPARERSRFVARATEKELNRSLFRDRLDKFRQIDADTHKPAKLRWKKPQRLTD